MQVLTYCVAAGIATVVCMPTVALSQQSGDGMNAKASCRQLLQEMRREVGSLDLGQQLTSRVEALFQQARQASGDEQCVRLLRQANGVVNSEIGERPLPDNRFRQALNDARSGNQATQGNEGRARAAAVPHSDAERIAVTYTSELIGRTVQDSQGNEVGEIVYMVIDTQNSDVRFAIVGSGGLFDIGEDLTAVPWDHLRVRTWGPNSEPRLRLDFTLDKLNRGRRLTHESLDQLADPIYQTEILTYYLPVESSASERGPERTRQRAAADKSGDHSASASDGDRPQRAESARGKDQQAARTKEAPPRSEARQDGAGENTLMLVGRGLVTTLAMSPLRTSSQIKGATVQSSDGREVGEIDRLVVDVERGKIAYALMARGGFLGIGEEWRAVPLAALRMSGQDTYVLDRTQSQVDAAPKLTRDELPSRIRLGDLKKLYETYGVEGYWQTRSQSDRRAGAQSGQPAGKR